MSSLRGHRVEKSGKRGVEKDTHVLYGSQSKRKLGDYRMRGYRVDRVVEKKGKLVTAGNLLIEKQ